MRCRALNRGSCCGRQLAVLHGSWLLTGRCFPNLPVCARCNCVLCAVQGGNEPRCLMDFWAQKCLEEIAEAEAEGLVSTGGVGQGGTGQHP